MSIRIDSKLPRFVERGKSATLDLPLRDDADAVQTLTSATLTITLGSTILVDAATITSFGPPATYALAASTTASSELSEAWLEVWSTNLGTFQVSGYLVRRVHHSHVTEGDLTSRYPEIVDDLSPEDLENDLGTSRYRQLAHEKVQRRLLARGRRPWLIFDSWALVDAEVALALHLWAADASIRYQDSPLYLRLRKSYAEEYESEWGKVTFREDTGETGTIDNGDRRKPAESPGIMLAATNPNRGSHRGWRYW